MAALCALAAAPAAADAATPIAPPWFANPTASIRPKFRWWWGDPPFVPTEVASEVDGFAKAGFGGAEVAFGEVHHGARLRKRGLLWRRRPS